MLSRTLGIILVFPEQFEGNLTSDTEVNPEEQCMGIIKRSGKMVGPKENVPKKLFVDKERVEGSNDVGIVENCSNKENELKSGNASTSTFMNWF